MTHSLPPPALFSLGSDLVTLAHYKYPKWVEFLSCELNYAVSSLHQFTTSLNVDLPAEEEEVRSSQALEPTLLPHARCELTNSILFPSRALSISDRRPRARTT